jgi:hypothetical protein
MNISLIMTAVQHGAIVANHAEVVALHKKPDPKRGGEERICAATVRDKMTGDEWVVRCRVSQKHRFLFVQANCLGRDQCDRTLLGRYS